MAGKQKHALVSSDMMSEGNIGVVYLGIHEPGNISLDRVEENLNNKLSNMLEEHFDAEIEIESIEIQSTTPISATARVHMIEGGVHSFNVEINETWVY
jgi:hypothetical protein